MRKNARLGVMVGGVILVALVLILVIVGDPWSSPPPQQADGGQQGEQDQNGNQSPALMHNTVITQTPNPLNNGDNGGQFHANGQFNNVGGQQSQGQVTQDQGSQNTGNTGQGQLVSDDGPRLVPEGSNTADAAAAGDKIYVVQPGDIYETIALKHYGARHLSHYIATANPGVDPRRLRVGQKLTIPDISKVRANRPAAVINDNSNYNPLTHYRVESGDTLTGISLKLYGTTKKFYKIYKANETKLPDMNRLKLGMLLKLPEPPTQLNNAQGGD